jgi:hypothetical protein
MTNISSLLNAEMQRLKQGPRSADQPGGVGIVRFVARCPVGANDVLLRATSVLRTINEASLTGWLTDEQWEEKLPEWFTAACAPPMTQEQAEAWLSRWKKLPPDKQARAEIEKDWSLENWLFWMEPDNRQWFWWDAKVLDDSDHIIVAVEAAVWPFPWGSLRWLFTAAGASALEPEA